MALKTNYKEDVLATANTKRKYNMITNDDGTVSFEDVTEYQQTGDNFGAADINTTNMAVNNITDGESTPIAKDWLFSDKIYHNSTAIGEVKTAKTTGAVTAVPPNVWTNTGVSITLPPGTHIIIGTVNFESSSDGTRGVRLATESSYYKESQHVITTGTTKHVTILQCACIVNLEESTTLYLQAWQGSKTAIGVNDNVVQATKIS